MTTKARDILDSVLRESNYVTTGSHSMHFMNEAIRRFTTDPMKDLRGKDVPPEISAAMTHLLFEQRHERNFEGRWAKLVKNYTEMVNGEIE